MIYGELTDLELELLGILQEECAEIIQIISKIRRFGLYSFWTDPEKTNRVQLHQEVGDVQAIIEMLSALDNTDDPVLVQETLAMCVEKKKQKLKKFLKHQQELTG